MGQSCSDSARRGAGLHRAYLLPADFRKATLSKTNAFDFVVTIAIGSTLATVLLSRKTTLSEGALAFALLIGLQFVVTWLSVRARWVRRLVTGEPLLMLYRGDFLPTALRQARTTENEVRAAVRSAGFMSLEEVEAVVLETDGSFSVIRQGPEIDSSMLQSVQRPGGWMAVVPGGGTANQQDQ